MSKRCIITYAEGAHEELLEISLPLYKDFAQRHGYDVLVGEKVYPDMPAAWNKIPLMLAALKDYQTVVWFDCDLIITDPSEDFPSMAERDETCHSLVRHFEDASEVPNSGVWRLLKSAAPLLESMLRLPVFTNHGWWEQAALMTLMGYSVPPEGSKFADTHCRCVYKTPWWRSCMFMRVQWNSHPNYRAPRPKIVHCSYSNMLQRIEVMRTLVRDPAFNYPRYDKDDGKAEDIPLISK